MFDFSFFNAILFLQLGTQSLTVKLKLLPKLIGILTMENDLREKLLTIVKNGIMFGTFTEDEFVKIKASLANKNFLASWTVRPQWQSFIATNTASTIISIEAISRE